MFIETELESSSFFAFSLYLGYWSTSAAFCVQFLQELSADNFKRCDFLVLFYAYFSNVFRKSEVSPEYPHHGVIKKSELQFNVDSCYNCDIYFDLHVFFVMQWFVLYFVSSYLHNLICIAEL